MLYIFGFYTQYTAVVLVQPLAVARTILRNRVCPSFQRVVCPGVFLEWIIRFLWIWHGARNPYHVVRDSWMFWKNVLCRKNRENGQKQAKKKGVLKKNLVNNFHWICSVMKIYNICCVLHKFYILWNKNLFQRYRSNLSQPIRFQDF